ncbi:cytochrome P450, partial [Geopyxis carbonaria]
YVLAKCVYKLWFHPLAKYPGPWWFACTEIPFCYYSVTGQPHSKWDELHKRYGPVVRLAPDTLSFATLKAAEDIYNNRATPFTKSVVYHGWIAKPRVYWSIVTAEEGHPRLRKIFAPCFHSKQLAKQERHMQRETKLMIEKIGKLGQTDKGIDMGLWFNCLTFDVVGSLALGKSFDSLKNGKHILSFRTHAITSYFKMTVFIDAFRRLHLSWIQDVTVALGSKADMRIKLRSYTIDAVKSRIENKSGSDDFFEAIEGLSPEDQLPFPEMVANSSAFVVAGSETTAQVLTATSYYLAKNPRVYKKLAEEIRTAFNCLEDVTSEATIKMPYLVAVLNEGLRMFPPKPIGGSRTSPGAFVDGNWVPKGTEAFVPHFTLSHDSDNFHDPYEFKPERWLDEDCKDNRKASIPFSLGARNCIGKFLALTEMRIAMAHLMLAYDFELVDKELDFVGQSKSFVSWHKPPVYMKFTPCKAIS